MHAHSLDARRITGAEVRHAHDLVGHLIGFLLELVPGLVDRELRLKQLVVDLPLRGLIPEIRLSSQCGSRRVAGGQPAAG